MNKTKNSYTYISYTLHTYTFTHTQRLGNTSEVKSERRAQQGVIKVETKTLTFRNWKENSRFYESATDRL
jgi:hypothetical protein